MCRLARGSDDLACLVGVYSWYTWQYPLILSSAVSLLWRQDGGKVSVATGRDWIIDLVLLFMLRILAFFFLCWAVSDFVNPFWKVRKCSWLPHVDCYCFTKLPWLQHRQAACLFTHLIYGGLAAPHQAEMIWNPANLLLRSTWIHSILCHFSCETLGCDVEGEVTDLSFSLSLALHTDALHLCGCN